MKFEEKELAALGIEVIDGDRGKNYPHKEELLTSGYCLFLSANNVTLNGFIFDNNLFISQEKDKTLRSGKLKRNDIVITTRGTIGNIALYDNSIPYDNIRINSGMLIVRCNGVINEIYLYYILKSNYFFNKIKAIMTGSAQPQLPKSHFVKMTIPVPNYDIQKKIADLLKNIDDIIGANNKANKNLQNKAFAIFDKIICNSQSEKTMLSEIAELNPKRAIAKNTEARCIDMSQLSTSGSFPNGWETKTFNGGMRFQNGDTLLARITPCLENGKTAYIDFLDENEIAFGSTEYIVLCSKSEYLPQFFYCLARYPEFVDYAVKNMNGSSGRQRVSADVIGKYEIPNLTADELKEFSEVVPPMFEVMRSNSLENIKLAQLRDTLLPKLISGEIDVSEVNI